MADLRKHSNTSNLIRFVLKNSSTGVGLTGLTSASSGLIISTIADNEAAATVYTQAGNTIETISTLGTFATPTATKCRFKEVDATNHPGLYEFQFADARFSVASGRRMVVTVSGAASLLSADYEIQLGQFDLYDSVRAGLTALPNAAAGANGGLPTGDASGRVDVSKVGGTSQTARDIGASVLVGDKTGFSLSSGGVQAIWDALTSALTTSGSIGKWIIDKIDVVLSTRLASSSYSAPLDADGTRTAVGISSANLDTQLSAINSKTTNLPSDPADASDIASSFSSLSSAISALPSAASIATAVWAAGTRTLTGFGTLVSDIWANASRTLSDKTGFSLTVTPPTANENADALLKRDLSAVTGEAARSPLNALRFLRNKWSVDAGTLTVKKEDDSTTAWTAEVSTDAAAEPITGTDPS